MGITNILLKFDEVDVLGRRVKIKWQTDYIFSWYPYWAWRPCPWLIHPSWGSYLKLLKMFQIRFLLADCLSILWSLRYWNCIWHLEPWRHSMSSRMIPLLSLPMMIFCWEYSSNIQIVIMGFNGIKKGGVKVFSVKGMDQQGVGQVSLLVASSNGSSHKYCWWCWHWCFIECIYKRRMCCTYSRYYAATTISATLFITGLPNAMLQQPWVVEWQTLPHLHSMQH